jgi:hypothetical protein
MSDLIVKGTVKEILPVQTGEGKNGTWSKSGFVVEYEDGKYNKSVAIETWGDKLELPGVGQDVSVSVNIESREYNGKWFTNVRAWKIETDGNDPLPVKLKQTTLTEEIEAGDDLPF